MNEASVLFRLGDFMITPYALFVTAGALLGILTACLNRKKLSGCGAPWSSIPSAMSLGMTVLLFSLLGSRLVYCATMIESILGDLGGVGFMARLWEGGYNLYGGIFGGILGCFVYARTTKQTFAACADVIAPGAAMALCLIRLGEYFTTQGLGHYIEEEAFQCFPFSVMSVYEDWQIPVFFYEALAALIVCVLLLCMGHKRPGRKGEILLVLVSVSQILLESFREDEFIRFGFVRFNQIAAAVTCFVLLVISIRRVTAGHLGGKLWQVIRTIVFVICIGIMVLAEFALDKSTIENTIIYGVFALTLCVMGFVNLFECRKSSAA